MQGISNWIRHIPGVGYLWGKIEGLCNAAIKAVFGAIGLPYPNFALNTGSTSSIGDSSADSSNKLSNAPDRFDVNSIVSSVVQGIGHKILGAVNTVLPADNKIVIAGDLTADGIMNALVDQLEYLLDGDNANDDGNYYTDDDWQNTDFDGNNIFSDDDWTINATASTDEDGNAENASGSGDDSGGDESVESSDTEVSNVDYGGNAKAGDTCAILSGSSKFGFQGEYVISSDLFNGYNIWDRIDKSFFIVHCNGRWGIRPSSYRKLYHSSYSPDYCPAMLHSKNDSEEWLMADWQQNTVVERCTTPSVTCVTISTTLSAVGNYKISEDMFDGYPIWDRKDNAYFVLHCGGRWHIFAKTYRAEYANKSSKVCNLNNGVQKSSTNDANEWYKADWRVSQMQFSLC